MPTNLPSRPIVLAESTRAGTFISLAAAVLMLVISGVTLIAHPDTSQVAAPKHAQAL